ncbi:MAG: chemotaxis protein CheW [Pseudomonadota bacterium]
MTAMSPKATREEDRQQFLTFRLGAELFSVGIDTVKEIIEYGEVTEVPAMPAQIRGVINLRGQAVPVVDLLAWFGRGNSKITRRTCIVIIEMEKAQGSGHRFVGVMVDTVNEVLDIPASDIQPPPAFGTTVRADFIKGMGQVRGKFIMILDIAQLLLSQDMMDLSSVLGGGASAHKSEHGDAAICPSLSAALKGRRLDEGMLPGSQAVLVKHPH